MITGACRNGLKFSPALLLASNGVRKAEEIQAELVRCNRRLKENQAELRKARRQLGSMLVKLIRTDPEFAAALLSLLRRRGQGRV